MMQDVQEIRVNAGTGFAYVSWALIASLLALLLADTPFVKVDAQAAGSPMQRAICYAAVVLLLGGASLATRGCMLCSLKRLNYSFGLLILWAGLSVAWSSYPSASAYSVVLTACTLFMTCLWIDVAVRVFTIDEICTIAAKAFLAWIGVSLLANLVLFGTPLNYIVMSEESTRVRLTFGSTHPLTVARCLGLAAIWIALTRWSILVKAVLLLGIALLLRLTDGNAAALIVPVSLLIVYIFSRARMDQYAFRLFLTGSAILVAVTLDVLLEGPLSTYLLYNPRLASVSGRSTIWNALINGGYVGSWVGWGFNTTRIFTIPIFGFSLQAHSEYIGVIIELGFVGLVLLALVYWETFRALAKSAQPAVCAIVAFTLISGLTSQGLLFDVSKFFPFLLAFALLRDGVPSTPVVVDPSPLDARSRQRPQVGSLALPSAAATRTT